MVTYRYLPDDVEVRLKAYRYHGEDKSYIFKYFWVPVCTRFVNALPVWIAPNVITLTALLFVCVTHVILAYYMPKMSVGTDYTFTRHELFNKSHGAEGGATPRSLPFAQEMITPPPPVVFVLCAMSLLVYQLLDNADGMQARRTGVTGPLGLLMDHGCDAFNCIVGSLSACAMLGTGPTWKTWIIVMNTLLVFLFNTWEHYYRGALVLPTINGPNEGILIAVGWYLWTAYVGGPQWWRNGAVEIPTRALPTVLRQPAPNAALDVERRVLDRVCPWLTMGAAAGAITNWSAVSESHGAGHTEVFYTAPFILNLNCSASYRARPPRPAHVVFNDDPKLARYEESVIGKIWIGQSPIQKMVLALYGVNEETIRIRYNTIALCIMTVLACMTIFGHIRQVFLALRRRTPEECFRLFGFRRFPFAQAVLQLVPIIGLAVLAQVWFVTSQEDIFRRHPRIFVWTVGLLFTKVSIHLMLAHVCRVPFRALRRTFMPFLLFAGHILLTYFHNVHKARRQHRIDILNAAATSAMVAHGGRGPVPVIAANESRAFSASPVQAAALFYSDYAYDLDEALILYEFFALSVVTFAHLVWSVVTDIAAILKVPVLTVPKAKQDALRAKLAAEKRASDGHSEKPAQNAKKTV